MFHLEVSLSFSKWDPKVRTLFFPLARKSSRTHELSSKLSLKSYLQRNYFNNFLLYPIHIFKCNNSYLSLNYPLQITWPIKMNWQIHNYFLSTGNFRIVNFILAAALENNINHLRPKKTFWHHSMSPSATIPILFLVVLKIEATPKSWIRYVSILDD